VTATTVAAEPVSCGTSLPITERVAIVGFLAWSDWQHPYRRSSKAAHFGQPGRSRVLAEGASVHGGQVSAQRRFGRLERHEPTPCRATRPSHRWSSRPASNVEPAPRAVELLAVRVDTRLRHRRRAAWRRLQGARRRSTGTRVRNRTPQPHGDDDGGHDAPRRHREQRQDNEQVQRVLPRA
jgi:hypothetical protein